MVIVMFAATTPVVTADRQLAEYLQLVNTLDFNPADLPLETAWLQYPLLRPLFSRVFCTPATSAPIERVFLQSGWIMRPHRARMSDSLLETLVFLKCNGRK